MFLIEKEDICCKSYLNIPYIFKDSLCMIYPVPIKEIVLMGREKYNFYLNLLIMDREDIKTLLKAKGFEPDDDFMASFTPFEYLMSSMENSDPFLLEIEKAFFTFIREKVTFLYDLKVIAIGDLTEKRYLDNENFQSFQEALKIQNKIEIAIEESIPENESEIAKKLRLNKLKIEEIKRKQKKESPDEDGATFSDLISSICAYGVGYTAFNVGDLSIYAFNDELERLQEKDKFALDIQSLLAGADSNKVNPKHWIRKLRKKE